MRRLLDELMRTGSVNMQASSPRLIVRIGYKSVNGPQSAIVTYNLNRDKWVLSTVKRLSDTGFYHDISLDNQMNFRVKVYSETSGTPWWNSVPNFLLLDDSNGDPFSTKLSVNMNKKQKVAIYKQGSDREIHIVHDGRFTIAHIDNPAHMTNIVHCVQEQTSSLAIGT
ncbi:hypothetical protein PsorP6_013797 [Peronosclerospora sorghi]|uniref:Uncharacterized protein n=1 Tax=Peronosclerospora sorghi TaxID=230839 RepID=A0ACC0VJ99_9STRA|nr:hypothetical protein PsorP6_013797 [Peronosclerospora sorghi]